MEISLDKYFLTYGRNIPWNYKVCKGQLISKRHSQAEDSPKKRTNEFVFTSMRRIFVRFLGESSARKKSFWDYLTFSKVQEGNQITIKYIVGSADLDYRTA